MCCGIIHKHTHIYIDSPTISQASMYNICTHHLANHLSTCYNVFPKSHTKTGHWDNVTEVEFHSLVTCTHTHTTIIWNRSVWLKYHVILKNVVCIIDCVSSNQTFTHCSKIAIRRRWTLGTCIICMTKLFEVYIWRSYLWLNIDFEINI